MKSINKRAFIMENCNSPYIAQAIFILKDGIDGENTKVIMDAERIVASYMGRGNHKGSKPEKKHTGLILTLCAIGLFTILISIFSILN